MLMTARVFAVLTLLAWCADALAVSGKDLLGTWEAARSATGDRLYVRLQEKGKAEVVAEYDFQLPGQPTRRGRSTTIAKWTVKGGELTLTYAKVRDRLRYNPKVPLAQFGQPGSAPALAQVGQADTNSRLRGAILWRAPHDYRLREAEPAAEQKK
jgi:hypothetical protein